MEEVHLSVLPRRKMVGTGFNGTK